MLGQIDTNLGIPTLTLLPTDNMHHTTHAGVHHMETIARCSASSRRHTATHCHQKPGFWLSETSQSLVEREVLE
ncbi:hypothetical protein RRG08_061362 [Elysia crispata]|uniref:Uncharacterized protein n=1 Tax=Elysia crispata TaxID=231223 RepID=A0AAE1DXL7_9GAST|nr:hypothetical protein RRG08_061362 [Elysia crispata]